MLSLLSCAKRKSRHSRVWNLAAGEYGIIPKGCMESAAGEYGIRRRRDGFALCAIWRTRRLQVRQ
ncbi:MAG: hypothetical protein J6V82_02440 [Clostridia bacterium]|nr:hypothetical protein [Clostridia bacterium]